MSRDRRALLIAASIVLVLGAARPTFARFRISSAVTSDSIDTDGDGVADGSDDCVLTPNPLQQDHDSDGIGDACDVNWSSKAIGNDTIVGDQFALAVSLSGDTLLVGSPNSFVGSVHEGVAYVLVRSGSTWTQQAKLVTSDGGVSDLTGWSVSVSGDLAVVGAPNLATSSKTGAAYVFRRTGVSWAQEAKLTPAGGLAGDNFGAAVATDGTRILVAARYDDTKNLNAGAAYVFENVAGIWTQTAKLLPNPGSSTENFGTSVVIRGDQIVVGAWREDSTNVSGAAYVFQRNGSNWTQQAKLKASDPGTADGFGVSVALGGSRIAVGANLKDQGATDGGAAYVFSTDGSTWTQEAKLVPQDPGTGAEFGISVAITGSLVAVGALGATIGGASSAGAVYTFQHVGSAWNQIAKSTTDVIATGSDLGTGLSISGTTLVAGAQGSASVKGTAHVFTLPVDGDSDGTVDAYDNCPTLANADQADVDGDGIGDACDSCIDVDHDGYGSPGNASCPAGAVSDCNDSNAAVHPGATETCNGIDDNCNGTIDEGVTTTFYRDADSDTFGNLAVTTQACSAPAGYVANSTDCNDSASSVHPGAAEVCNGIDDNCNGQTDEGVTFTFYRDADGDGYGNPAITSLACAQPAGYVADNTDCNDANASVNPGKTEIPGNGLDDDCNPATSDCKDLDADGYGNPASADCAHPQLDCNDANANINPGKTEIPGNGLDDDCNPATPGGCSAP